VIPDSVDCSDLDSLSKRDLEKVALPGRRLGQDEFQDLHFDAQHNLFGCNGIKALSPAARNANRTLAEFLQQAAKELLVAAVNLPD